MSRLRLVLVPLAASVVLSACARGGSAPESASPEAAAGFAALQVRGQEAMGVDQYTSTHLFDALPDGGRIELQRDADDPAGVAQIREHLQHIASAFKGGDFGTPAFVHMRSVPGTDVMARKRDAITYEYGELPRGGELRIRTQDPQAVAAIHAFMEFQRQDHRAGGAVQGGGGEPAVSADRSAPAAGAAGHDATHGPGMGMHATMHDGDALGMPGAMHGGAGMGMHAAMHGGATADHASVDGAAAADMELVHALLESHDAIQRTVTHLPNGVRAVTESQDPRVAAYIKEHVGNMSRRLQEGEVFNVASPTIPVIFANAEKIRTEIEETDDGVVFTQTTDVPELVPVLQAHADEVSELVKEGMAAMMRGMMERGGVVKAGGPRP